MAKPELGTKRLCAGCGAKFYDLSKSPIICPKCQTVYEVAPPPRSRGDNRAAAAAAVAPEEAPEAAEVETVPLEEADADTSGKVAAATPETEDDIEVDETLDDDDDSTFIAEEEEGEDDVSDIVGDRDADEET